MSDQNNPINPLRLKSFLPYRLSILSNRISRAIADRYEKHFSLSVPEWRTMAILGEETNISAVEVAERSAMDKVAVSRAVKVLLEAGYIERHFSREDKRRSVLALSKQGLEVYEKVVPLALSYERALLDGLSNQEQGFLDKILNKLNDIQLHTVDDSEQ
jgi:DNA-binding MarR family transcriptional regulator